MTRNWNEPRPRRASRRRTVLGTTLTEVIISIAVTALAVGSMVSGYVFSVDRAEWSARSAAAQILTAQRIEQTRAARWDTMAGIDEVVTTNFPVEIVPLNMPSTSTTGVLATNITTITLVSPDPPLKIVRVDCLWSFLSRGPFTNTLITYRSPDQ
jgi:type II secretory pathway pseudopilin PulG